MVDAAATDLVLAGVSSVFGWRLLGRGPSASTAGVGLLLVGVAAAFGVVRFGFAPSMEIAHTGVSRLAAMVGVPLIGVGWCTSVFAPSWGQTLRPYAFVLLLVAAVALIAVEPYRVAIGGLGMIAVLVAAGAAARRNPVAAALGALGAVAVLVAGLVVVGEGSFGPMSRIGWFHLALAGANLLLGAGLLRLSEHQAAAQPHA